MELDEQELALIPFEVVNDIVDTSFDAGTTDEEPTVER